MESKDDTNKENIPPTLIDDRPMQMDIDPMEVEGTLMQLPLGAYWAPDGSEWKRSRSELDAHEGKSFKKLKKGD